MTVVFYISGHGFGHASRVIELMNTIAQRAPRARLIARTAVARWFFRTCLAPVEVQALTTDTGACDVGPGVDADETARQAARFYADFEHKIDEEAAVLHRVHASVVVGDIPPLAFAAAARAGLPSVAVANFTWDWIYAAYPRFAQLAPGVLSVVTEAYQQATCALRLPMHGGFAAMAPVVRDIPYIARASTRDPRETRRLLGLDPSKVVVLAYAGRQPLPDAYAKISEVRAVTLVTIDREPLSPGGAPPPLAGGLRYPDLVAAADVVVSKPGYGIISDCLANQTALLYTSRRDFVEYDVLVAEMPRVLRCRHVPEEDRVAGRWEESLRALLDQPPPRERPQIDGAEVACGEILNLAEAD